MGIRFFLLLLVTLSISLPSVAAPESLKYEDLPEKEVPAQSEQTIKAGPLSQPLSSQLREERQQMEMETEERMAQEIEKTRIEDERARRERLFANPMMLSQPRAMQPASNPEGMLSQEYAAEPYDDIDNYYIGLNAGLLNYPRVDNVDVANALGGVSFGVALPADFWIEGSFLYSFQESQINSVSRSFSEDIDHLGLGLTAAYHWHLSALPEWMTPRTGLTLAYTNRQYDGGDSQSQAFDGGLVAGLDMRVARGITLGFEYRFMTNFNYEREDGPGLGEVALRQSATGTSAKDLESFEYQMFMIGSKFSF